ncbi:hypothetical protein XELAEV_18026879mg [Xenopus laevis]|uniref:Uncharacterized protein n=1 Tax=Xenopus laevis TaxID=8355 RepID=A0A974HJF1_XENLA|nr:hypothetical protein XELAEV_18026879mg [Xenopus laevis]
MKCVICFLQTVFNPGYITQGYGFQTISYSCKKNAFINWACPRKKKSAYVYRVYVTKPLNFLFYKTSHDEKQLQFLPCVLLLQISDALPHPGAFLIKAAQRPHWKDSNLFLL